MNYSNEQLEKAVQSLPREFQEAIASSNVSDKVLEIGKRYNLHVDQMGKLKDTAMLATLNLISPTNFSETLSKELFLPIAKAQSLVSDINKEIFEKIKERIKENTKKEEPIEEEETPTSIPTIEIISTPIKNKPEVEEIEKDRVLKEIEENIPQKPTPPPVVVKKEEPKKEAFTVSNISIPKPEPVPPPINTSVNISNVLNEKVSIPPVAQKKEVEEIKTPPPPPKIDPYREPIH